MPNLMYNTNDFLKENFITSEKYKTEIINQREREKHSLEVNDHLVAL